jgi:zinc transport system substrate-binding protein
MESVFSIKGTFMKTKRYKKALAILVLAAAVFTSLGAESLKVVATTEWTAAFCRAAGITDVRVLAPASLQHPADYELKPSDIPALMEADLIFFGGYEAMMERIRSHVAGSETVILQIVTAYAPPVIETSIKAIAEAAGTQDSAEMNLLLIREAFAEARRLTAEAGLAGSKAVVHQFQVPFARGAGLDVVKEFGPAPPGLSPKPQKPQKPLR